MNIDVLEEWNKIVEISKDCSIVFNMIDVGEYLDLAVQSLALRRGIPFCLGGNWITSRSLHIVTLLLGTFRSSITVDFYKHKGNPCWSCITDVPNKEVARRLTVDQIEHHKSIDFIPKDNNPVGESNVFVCCTCCNFMISMFVQVRSLITFSIYLIMQDCMISTSHIFG